MKVDETCSKERKHAIKHIIMLISIKQNKILLVLSMWKFLWMKRKRLNRLMMLWIYIRNQKHKRNSFSHIRFVLFHLTWNDRKKTKTKYRLVRFTEMIKSLFVSTLKCDYPENELYKQFLQMTVTTLLHDKILQTECWSKERPIMFEQNLFYSDLNH